MSKENLVREGNTLKLPNDELFIDLVTIPVSSYKDLMNPDVPAVKYKTHWNTMIFNSLTPEEVKEIEDLNSRKIEIFKNATIREIMASLEGDKK